jgi:hypothetical protein
MLKYNIKVKFTYKCVKGKNNMRSWIMERVGKESYTTDMMEYSVITNIFEEPNTGMNWRGGPGNLKTKYDSL